MEDDQFWPALNRSRFCTKSCGDPGHWLHSCPCLAPQGAVQGVSSSDGYGGNIGHFVDAHRRDGRLPTGTGTRIWARGEPSPGLFSMVDHQSPDIVAHASTLVAMGLCLARKFAWCRPKVC